MEKSGGTHQRTQQQNCPDLGACPVNVFTKCKNQEKITGFPHFPHGYSHCERLKSRVIHIYSRTNCKIAVKPAISAKVFHIRSVENVESSREMPDHNMLWSGEALSASGAGKKRRTRGNPGKKVEKNHGIYLQFVQYRCKIEIAKN